MTAPVARLTNAGDFLIKPRTATNQMSFTRNNIPNLAVGDLLAVHYTSQGIPTDDVSVVTGPAGFVRVSPSNATNPRPRYNALFLYPVKDQAALDALGFNVDHVFSDTASAGRRTLTVFRITGANLDLRNLTIGARNTLATPNLVQSVGSIGLPEGDMLILGLAAATHGSSTDSQVVGTSLPGGAFVQTIQPPLTPGTPITGSWTTGAIAYATRSEPGVEPAFTMTWNNLPASNQNAFAVAIAPAVPAAPKGLPGKVVKANGTVGNADWFVVKSDGQLAVPQTIKTLPKGYSSIEDMLSRPRFYIAHRGGSTSFPEHSLHAYTQSAYRGFGALEVSLARTKDGVWLGCHDASLDYQVDGTGGGAGTKWVAANMTWDEVQEHTIGAHFTTDTSQPRRPFMRLEEVLDAYWDSHVFFIDPKAATSYREELLNLLDRYPDPQTKVVAKFFGQGTPSWITAAKARGYKTWGYFYSGQGNPTRDHGQYDYIGLNIGAPQADWDLFKSWGQPIIAHLGKTQADADAAWSKGANGLMTPGTKLVLPT